MVTAAVSEAMIPAVVVWTSEIVTAAVSVVLIVTNGADVSVTVTAVVSDAVTKFVMTTAEDSEIVIAHVSVDEKAF